MPTKFLALDADDVLRHCAVSVENASLQRRTVLLATLGEWLSAARPSDAITKPQTRALVRLLLSAVCNPQYLERLWIRGLYSTIVAATRSELCPSFAQMGVMNLAGEIFRAQLNLLSVWVHRRYTSTISIVSNYCTGVILLYVGSKPCLGHSYIIRPLTIACGLSVRTICCYPFLLTVGTAASTADSAGQLAVLRVARVLMEASVGSDSLANTPEWMEKLIGVQASVLERIGVTRQTSLLSKAVHILQGGFRSHPQLLDLYFRVLASEDKSSDSLVALEALAEFSRSLPSYNGERGVLLFGSPQEASK